MMRFERFTERAQDAAARAYEILQRYGHNQVDTEHILLALLEQTDGAVPQVLEQINIDVNALRDEVDKMLRAMPKAAIYGGGTGQVFITPRVKRIIDLANEEANRMRDSYISSRHLFLGILGERNTAVSRLMQEKGITRERVVDVLPQDPIPNDSTAFSEKARLASTLVDEVLQKYGHDKIDTEHILMGLLDDPDKVLTGILQQLGVDVNTFYNQLDGILRAEPKRQIALTLHAANVMKIADRIAADEQDKSISVEHLFAAILYERNTVVGKLIADHGITQERAEQVMKEMRSKGQSQS
jgi:ATP-dependent Clp protease ATP-binding subunit ClpA